MEYPFSALATLVGDGEGQLGIPLTAPSSFLPRPLHIAARNGLASVVQALLSRGATVLAVDEEGEWGPEPPASPRSGVRDILQEVTSSSCYKLEFLPKGTLQSRDPTPIG